MLQSYRFDSSTLKTLLFETVFCLTNKLNRSDLQCLGRSLPTVTQMGNPVRLGSPHLEESVILPNHYSNFGRWHLCPSPRCTSAEVQWVLTSFKLCLVGNSRLKIGYFIVIPRAFFASPAATILPGNDSKLKAFHSAVFLEIWQAPKAIISFALFAW